MSNYLEKYKKYKLKYLNLIKQTGGVEIQVTYKGIQLTINVPENHICSTAGSLFDDPVIAADGQTYERVEIEKLFQRNEKSPSTGVRFISKKLL